MSLTLICLAVVLLGCISAVRCLRSPLAKVPGPRLSLFTSLPLKYHEFRATRTQYIHELHKVYGNAVRIGPNEVAFTSLDAMKEIYMSKGSGYDKTEFYDLFTQFDTRTMFSTLNKDTHAKRRRIIADRYANTNVIRDDSLHGIQERAQKFIRKIMELPSHEMDIYVYLHCYAFDCVTHHLFHPYGSDSLTQQKDEEAMREVSFSSRIVARLLRYYNPTLSAIVNWSGILGRAGDISLAKALVLNATSQKAPASFTLAHRMQEERFGMQPVQVAAECMDHMLAGIETTSDALCFLMWQISQPGYEHVQQRLCAELSESREVPFDQLRYLDAVVKEGLRVFPTIPMSLPRYVPKGGGRVDGYWLPEGTIVSCQPYSMNRMDENTFPQPDEFRPERWLEEKGDLERNRLFFTFSSGGRGCIGRHLAVAEMKVLLRNIYLNFKTVPAKGMNADMEMDHQLATSRPKDQRCTLEFVARD